MSLRTTTAWNSPRVLRWGLLALVALGQLPVPIAHAHGGPGGITGSARLARHVALFHGGQVSGSSGGWHVHFLPVIALRNGGAADATGTEGGDALAGNDFSPTTATPAVDSPLAVAAPVMVAEDSADNPTPRGAPAAFLQTFSFETDLSGLIGVARC